MSFVEMLPIIIYMLLIVLLIILIVLGIKIILVVDKTDKLLVDIQDKVSSFNGVFRLIDLTGEKLSIGITSIIEGLISLINKIFKRKKEDEEYE